MLWLVLSHSLRFSGYGQGVITQVPWTYDFVNLTWVDYRALYWRGSLHWRERLGFLRLRAELSQEVLWGNSEAIALQGQAWDTTYPLRGYLSAQGPGSAQRVWFKELSAEASFPRLSAGFGRRFVDWGLAWFASPLRVFSRVQRLGWDPEDLVPTDCAWGSLSLGILGLEGIYSLDTAWGLKARAFAPLEWGGAFYAGRDTALGLFSSLNAFDGALKLEAAFFKGGRPGYSVEWSRTFGSLYLISQFFVNPWAGPPSGGLFARQLAFLSLQRSWEGVWEAWSVLAYAPSDGSAMALVSLSRLFTSFKITLGASYTTGREFTSQFGILRPAGALSFEAYP